MVFYGDKYASGRRIYCLSSYEKYSVISPFKSPQNDPRFNPNPSQRRQKSCSVRTLRWHSAKLAKGAWAYGVDSGGEPQGGA
jgi:hypothetical protein